LEPEIDFKLAHVFIGPQSLKEHLAFFRSHPLTDLERRGAEHLISAEPDAPEKLSVSLEEFSVSEPREGH